MPTYVYECSSCQDVFEVDQRIVEDPLKDCKCGSKGTLKRLIQPTAVMFKGSGFYVNDSAGKTAPKEKAGAADDAPIPEPKTPASTESVVTTPSPTPLKSDAKSDS